MVRCCMLLVIVGMNWIVDVLVLIMVICLLVSV